MLHRSHWYLKEVGSLFHVPVEPVSLSPTLAVPVIVGSTVFTGAAEATRAVDVDVALVEPVLLVAVTTTRMVCPTSAEATV